MRVTINGSGAILTHGDSLSGGGVIEFPINEPPEFVHTLTAYTVTGSAPSRKLKYQGHEIAVESPTATAERAPSTGSGVTVDNTTDPPTAVTTLVAPGASITDATATLVGLRRIGPFPIAFDDAGLDADGVTLTTLPAGTIILNAWIEITTQWAFDTAGGNIFIGATADFATCKQYVIPSGNTSIPVSTTTNTASELGTFERTVDSVVRLVNAGPLLALIDFASRTAGEADIYAIIATPAS